MAGSPEWLEAAQPRGFRTVEGDPVKRRMDEESDVENWWDRC